MGKKLTELSDLWYDSKWPNISVIEVQEGKERREKDKERKKQTERIHLKMMAGNFINLRKIINPEIQECQQTPVRINIKTPHQDTS